MLDPRSEITTLERALRERPDDPNVRGRLGLLYNRLGKTFNGKTISAWVNQLGKATDFIRQALDNLAAIGPPALLALPAIKTLLDHESLDLRIAAAETYAILATDAGELKDILGGQSFNGRAAVIAALRELGLPALSLLEKAVTDPHFKLRASAAEALGHIGQARSLQALRNLLSDPALQVRTNATYAIANINEPEAVLILTEAFNDETNGDIAANALRNSSRLILAPILIPRFDDPRPEIRRRVVVALGSRSSGRSIRTRALADPNEGVRRAAIRLQPVSQDDEELNDRHENGLLSSHDGTRARTFQLIGRHFPEFVEDAMIGRLRDPFLPARLAAAETLGRLGVGPALPKLRRAANSPNEAQDDPFLHAVKAAILAIEHAIKPDA